jgi:hypothetical protein
MTATQSTGHDVAMSMPRTLCLNMILGHEMANRELSLDAVYGQGVGGA